MQGAFFLAYSKRSRTRDAPTPTNISINSAADIEKKGTPASPATAFANKVLPVPGGPIRRAPLGILAPSFVYCSGCFKKSTTSASSYLASLTPATSPKVTPVFGSIYKRAFDFPTFIGFIPPPKPTEEFL